MCHQAICVTSLCLCDCRGTPGWTAPELYAQNLPSLQKHKSAVCAAADVYAAGWVFFEVLCGLSPLLFREAKSDADFAAGKLTLMEPVLSHGNCGMPCLQQDKSVLNLSDKEYLLHPL